MSEKLAVITGAGQGMGRATALKFAREGVHVVLVSRTQETLESVGGEIAAFGGRFTLYPADVTDAAQIHQLEDSIGERPVDMLINCAGEALIKPMEDSSEEDFDRLFAVNLKAPFLMARAFVSQLRMSENASIINIGSLATQVRAPGIALYAATKTGLLGLTRSLSAELKADQIRVILLNPSPADTPMRWAATPDYDPAMLISPEAIAEMIWTLCNLPRGVTTSDFVLQSITQI